MKATLPRISLDLEPELSSALKELAEGVARFGEANGLSQTQIHNLSLALDELATNTISYGFAEVDKQELRVELRIEDDEVVAQLVDTGIPFNPFEEAAAPDVHAALDDRPIGGLGVFLTKTLFPNPNYQRTDGLNRITLRAPLKGDS
ncbi:MAG: ATP-binding protein [Deltaproteobacteria bacterium]|nr:ATP-binding protein [Deltaproteobacteria bacterium]